MKSQSPSPKKPVGARTPALAPTSQNPVVPEDVRALLGPSWIIEGEDTELYEALLARVGTAVEPADIIDWFPHLGDTSFSEASRLPHADCAS
jgi:hypothetical protein